MEDRRLNSQENTTGMQRALNRGQYAQLHDREPAVSSSGLSNLVIVRGGGDIASGTIHKLHQCGFPVVVLEIPNPSCIRRTVSFCEAVYGQDALVEGVRARKTDSIEEALNLIHQGIVPVMIDPEGNLIRRLHPAVVVDAILAKRNLGIRIEDAAVVIGLGPGFTAGQDVHAVIETKRGHNLGRVIYEGMAAPDTGIPGMIAGYAAERVIHAPASGRLQIIKDIGEETVPGQIIARIIKGKEDKTVPGKDIDKGMKYIREEEAPGDALEYIEGIPVEATIPGIIRGMIRDGYPVTKGLKIADIDPRIEEKKNCTSISDKARCIAGGVLEAILHCSM